MGEDDGGTAESASCTAESASWAAEPLLTESRQHLAEKLRVGGIAGDAGFPGQREGDGAEAAKQSAEETAGFAVGDAGGAIFEETFEDGVSLGGDLGGVEPGDAAAEVGPAGEAGVAVAPGERRGPGDGGFGAVVAAEGLVAGGGGVTGAAVGEAEGAFAGLHGTLLEMEKARRGPGFFFFSTL